MKREKKMEVGDMEATITVEKKKKIDGKDILKKVVFGLGCAVAGVLAFCLVGVAMTDLKDDEPEDDSIDTGSEAESSDEASCEVVEF